MNMRSEEIIFSRREYESMLWLSRGKTIKEVARILQLSPKTVEGHLAHAKDKTNCTFRSQLLDLFWAIQ